MLLLASECYQRLQDSYFDFKCQRIFDLYLRRGDTWRARLADRQGIHLLNVNEGRFVSDRRSGGKALDMCISHWTLPESLGIMLQLEAAQRNR